MMTHTTTSIHDYAFKQSYTLIGNLVATGITISKHLIALIHWTNSWWNKMVISLQDNIKYDIQVSPALVVNFICYFAPK